MNKFVIIKENIENLIQDFIQPGFEFKNNAYLIRIKR